MVLKFVIEVATSDSDWPCGHASDDRVGRYITSDHRSSGHNSTLTHRDSGQYERPCRNIRMIFDDNRTTTTPEVIGLWVVVHGENLDVAANIYGIPDC